MRLADHFSVLYDGLTSSGRHSVSEVDERQSKFYVTEISQPIMFKHVWHVTFDEETQKFQNLPVVFEQLLNDSNIRSVC